MPTQEKRLLDSQAASFVGSQLNHPDKVQPAKKTSREFFSNWKQDTFNPTQPIFILAFVLLSPFKTQKEICAKIIKEWKVLMIKIFCTFTVTSAERYIEEISRTSKDTNDKFYYWLEARVFRFAFPRVSEKQPSLVKLLY